MILNSIFEVCNYSRNFYFSMKFSLQSIAFLYEYWLFSGILFALEFYCQPREIFPDLNITDSHAVALCSFPTYHCEEFVYLLI